MRVAVWLTLFSAGCATTAPTVEVVRPRSAPLVVRLAVGAKGPVHVTLQAATAREGEARLEFIRLSPGYAARFIPGLGSTLVVSPGQPRLDYDVQIPGLAAPGTEGLHGAFDTPNGRALPLWAVLPVFRGALDSELLYPVVVSIDTTLPVLSSLPRAEDGTFIADEPNALMSALFLVGKTQVAEGRDGVKIASFDFTQSMVEQVAVLERRASDALVARTGPRKPLKLIAVHRLPEGASREGVMGVNVLEDASMFFATTYDGRASSTEGITLLHELAHSSLPPRAGLPLWMGEGFAEYFARLLSVQLDGLPAGALYDGLESTWSAFVAEAPTLRPLEQGISNYYAGAVLAYCIDIRLRREGRSLEEVLRRAKARSELSVTNSVWEQEMALASSSAGVLIANAKTGLPLQPVETCFEEAGLHPGSPVPAVTESGLRQALRVSAVDGDPRHADIIVRGVDPSSQLAPGDTIIAVNEQRVWSTQTLRQALARMAGGRVRVQFVREGRQLTLSVEVPPLRDPRTPGGWQ